MWGATFQLVTNVNNLSIGDEIIIVNSTSSKALGTTQNNNNRNAVSVTISSNQIEPGNNVQIITLGKTNNHWSLNVGNGYLYAASSSKNYLRTQTAKNTNGEWNITISNNNATIIAQGSNTHNILRYNSNDNIFSCYNSGQQPVQIYKKIGSGPIEYTVSFINELGKSPNSITQASLGATVNLPTNVNICNKCYTENWEFYGWVTDRNNRAILSNPFTPTKDTTLYALYSRRGIKDVEIEEYKLVSKDQGDWEGEYLIAYIDENDHVLIADGRIGGGDNGTGGLMSNGTKLNPGINLTTDSTILLSYGDLYSVIIEHLTETTYGIKTKDDYYNYGTKSAAQSKSNNITIALKHQIMIEFNNERDITISCYDSDNDAIKYMRYNVSDNGYFRFYGSGQKSITLFKRQKSHYPSPIEYSTSPECDTAYITTWNTDKIYLDKSLLNITDPQDITIKDINTGEVLLNNSTLLYNSDLDAYQIPINLSSKACDKLNILTKNTTDSLYMIYKVPFMVAADSYTSDMIDENCDIVVLDNKTLTVSGTSSANRDLKLYPGAKLKVPTGTSYNLNSLALRRDNNTVSSLALVGDLTLNHLYFDLYIDYKDWYYVALPDEFNISNLRFTNEKSATQREDYWIKYYDGKHRAETQSGSWKSAANDTTFMPGCGFIIGIPDDYIKKELRFEFDVNRTLTNEKSNKTSGNVTAWGITNPSLTPNHKGWNLVGNPYMNIYDTDFASVIRAGELIKDETSGQWNGHWLVSDTTSSKLRYAVIPSKDPEDAAAGGYKSVVLDEKPLDPFICFFVQMGGNNENPQTLKFKVSRRRNNIVASSYQEQEDEELFLRIKIGDKKTGCFISNHFNENYEPGDDLESRYAYYQLINGYKLLYSAINDSIIENGIQIHSLGGKVTLDPKVETEKFEQIYILYNNEWYDLLHGDEPEVSSNFVLYGKRKVSEDIPTDIGNIKPGQGTYKFLHENNIFINNKGKIYNIFGSQVK